MFVDDLVAGVDKVDIIKVESLSGVILFYVPSNAVQLFEEGYWSFVEYLQIKNKNIISVKYVKNAFVAIIDKNRENLLKRSVWWKHNPPYASMVDLSNKCFQNVVRNDPNFAAKYFDNNGEFIDEMSKDVWNNEMFIFKTYKSFKKFRFKCATREKSVCLHFDGIIKNCNKKMFRRTMILRIVQEHFHELRLDQLKAFNVPRKTFVSWLETDDNTVINFDHIWSGCRIPAEEFKPEGFMSRYVNETTVALWKKRYDEIITSQ